MLKRLILLAFLLVLSLPERAEGGASLALSMAELVSRADVIAHVRATGERAYFRGDRIITEVDLAVERAIAERSSRRELRIMIPGGVVGSIGMRVEGAPRFKREAEAILFANESERGLRAVGMSQGVFPIERRGDVRVVQPSGHGLALYTRDVNGRLMRSRGALNAPLPLDEFIGLIERELESR